MKGSQMLRLWWLCTHFYTPSFYSKAFKYQIWPLISWSHCPPRDGLKCRGQGEIIPAGTPVHYRYVSWQPIGDRGRPSEIQSDYYWPGLMRAGSKVSILLVAMMTFTSPLESKPSSWLSSSSMVLWISLSPPELESYLQTGHVYFYYK